MAGMKRLTVCVSFAIPKSSVMDQAEDEAVTTDQPDSCLGVSRRIGDRQQCMEGEGG